MSDDIKAALQYVRTALQNTDDEGIKRRLRSLEILLIELEKHRKDVATALLSRKAF